MVEWILINKYQVAELVHYLDDFITAGPQNSNVCARNLSIALRVCSELGIPLHPDKCEGPSTVLVVLGIELDSINQIARLPSDKLSKLRVLLDSWASRQWCRRKELQSLIGHLHHAAKVVWPGRTFLRRMINLLCCFRNDGHPIRLNAEFHLDLNWWLQFLETWNGVSFWLYPGMSAVPTMEVTSDAAGALGYGAYFNHEWFNGLWFACLPTAGSVGPTVTDPNTKSSVGGSHFASLELRCRELLLQGLAPSTRRSYATGQKRFINFCTQLGK
ncbi:hypothetical protein QZH41_012486, partial [Actinostola sp. cb2023]